MASIRKHNRKACAWPVFPANSSWSRLKLILVMSSSDKYVFVSGNGLHRREILRRDLIEGIARGNISVLSSDSRYDDTLNRVVDGLQRKNKVG